MKDRIVENPNRYLLEPVEGMEGVVDLVPFPGEVAEEGTPLNKATLLSDGTAVALGLTQADPTVDEALRAIPGLVEPVGTVKTTMRTDLGENWLLCNGGIMPKCALYNALPAFDMTQSVYWKKQNLIKANARCLYENGVIYEATVADGKVNIRESSDLGRGFSLPRTIISTGFQGNTVSSVLHFKKLRSYYVLVLQDNLFVSIAYASSVYGTYTYAGATSGASYGAPSFIGCTSKLFYYVMQGAGSDSTYRELKFYYSASIGALTSGGAKSIVLDTIYSAYSRQYQNITHAENDNYLAIGAYAYTKPSDTTYTGHIKMYMVDMRDPSSITYRLAYSANELTGKTAWMYLIGSTFYGAYLSGSNPTWTYLKQITMTTTTDLVSSSTASFAGGHVYFVKNGKIHLFSPNFNKLYVAGNMQQLCTGPRSVYDIEYGGSSISITAAERAFITDDYIFAYDASAASLVCTKYLPDISLADLTYSYIRSE